VLAEATTEVRALGHHYLPPEHLVLGLLSLPDELAANVLTELGVTPEAAHEKAVPRLGSAAARPTGSLVVAPQTNGYSSSPARLVNRFTTSAPAPLASLSRSDTTDLGPPDLGAQRLRVSTPIRAARNRRSARNLARPAAVTS
jgi:hypothetical protein